MRIPSDVLTHDDQLASEADGRAAPVAVDDEEHLAALPRGTMLHEYRIERVLGQGGFGITYRAEDTHLHETVAIKEYFPSRTAIRTGDQSARARSKQDAIAFRQGVDAFLTEARLIARFRHPNIMRVRRFFEAHGTGYMVLDFIEGRSLEAVLAAGALPEPVLRSVLGGILAGLGAVHDDAVLHRDLKPRNVILRRDGTPVLIDFGAARDFGSRHSQTVTQIVSPGYSSPEQYGIGERQGPWSDFYSVGAIFYRAVTGSTPIDSLRRLRTDPLVPASTAAAGRYDARLLRVIDALLAIEPMARPGSAVDIMRDLAMPDPVPTARHVEWAPRRWDTGRTRAAAAAVLGALVLIGGVSLSRLVPHGSHAGPEVTHVADTAKPSAPANDAPASPPAPQPRPASTTRTETAPSISHEAAPAETPGSTPATGIETATAPEANAPGETPARPGRDATPETDHAPEVLATSPMPPVPGPRMEVDMPIPAALAISTFAAPGDEQAVDLTPDLWLACAAAGYCDVRLLPALRDAGAAGLPWVDRQAYQMWSLAVLGEVYRLPWEARPAAGDLSGLEPAETFDDMGRSTCPTCGDLAAGPIVDPTKHVPMPLGLIDDDDADAAWASDDASDGAAAPSAEGVRLYHHGAARAAGGSWHRPARFSGNDMLRHRHTRSGACPPVRVGAWQIYGTPASGSRLSAYAASPYGASWQPGCIYGRGR